MPDPLSFETALDRLESAVAALEAGDLGLDAALARYEEGVGLLARLNGLLDGAERRVALLADVTADGEPRLASFDATPSSDGQAR